ncbi:PREDICTED: protein S100-A13, partial [Leptosomus discolor]|uniref:protein S100-A13 n=1 Tax=Leptosomus discolor TaxID=188344 RepID=UPI0005226E15
MATGELTELETAIEKIVTVFFAYAGKEGKKGTLTAGEFKELVQIQLPNLMK